MPLSTEATKCKVCESPAKFQCSICKDVRYCSVAHQRQHWPTHKTNCTPIEVPPIKEFLESNHFGSYYMGASSLYKQVGMCSMGPGRANTIMSEFLVERFERAVELGDQSVQAQEADKLSVKQMTKNRFECIKALFQNLSVNYNFTEEQLQQIKEPLEKARSNLKGAPLGYICGYAHASLEVLQRLMQRDLSSEKNATLDGAATVAALTVGLVACRERLLEAKNANK